MPTERFLNFFDRWSLLTRNEFVRRDEYSAEAIAALTCTSFDEGLAKNVRDVSGNPFDRLNAFAGGIRDQISA
ncbi:hypothetical protein FBZ94_10538 [Bradyrhizobium sacchari]|uniref:Uncharacterized protein n=1 Tax=Bradyrhizobium sacchari TaxID=1399419 RepID=A0A560JP03_9BRAD|nr:hypothetical protein FBZ94_10538 [Bradyrhizobium sacchari]TWB72878.1 hypothetical protein FBZ95_106593 [Bradyrhizobium sacchari]